MRHVKLFNVTRQDIYRPLFGKIRARDFIAVDKSRITSISKEYPNLIGRGIVVRPITEKKPPIPIKPKIFKKVNVIPIIDLDMRKKLGRPKQEIKRREMITVKE